MLPLIFAAQIAIVSCGEGLQRWRPRSDGSCWSVDMLDPKYALPDAPVPDPVSVEQAGEQDWKRTIRACYEIGRMTDIMIQSGMNKTPDGYKRIQEGRDACFMDGKP